MTEQLETPVPHTTSEELQFVFQAAVAPLSILKRVVANNQTLLASTAQAFDRDSYLRYLRTRQNTKKNVTKSSGGKKAPVSPMGI